jgi:hypothetical protein
MPITILILSDGETFTDADGCRIVTLTDEGGSILDETGDPREVPESEILSTVRMISA